MLWEFATGVNLGPVIEVSGEFAARFTIFALMLTPLMMLFPRSNAIRWLLRRRRYLGVAAFGYALLHTLAYLVNTGSPNAAFAEITRTAIWIGWIAFVLFVPLALTSNAASVRALGRRWKWLQRLVYPAALLTAAHWFFLTYQWGGVLTHFLPLALLEVYRVWRSQPSRINP